MALLRKSFEQPEQPRRPKLEIVEPVESYPSIKRREAKSDSQYFGKGTELPFAQETMLTQEEQFREQQIAQTKEYLDDLFGAGSAEYVPPKLEVTRGQKEDPWSQSPGVDKAGAARKQYEEHQAHEQEIIELQRARQERGEW